MVVKDSVLNTINNSMTNKENKLSENKILHISFEFLSNLNQNNQNMKFLDLGKFH
jgi:hypothetical protein